MYFQLLGVKSHEYSGHSVAYENLQPSTDAYKRVAYKKMSVEHDTDFLMF